MPTMIERKDYKAVKHMDRAQMTAYLQTVYRRGFEAGVKAVKEQSSVTIKKSSGVGISEFPPGEIITAEPETISEIPTEEQPIKGD